MASSATKNYAGFGVRFIAALIDGIVVGVVTGLIDMVLRAVMGDSGSSIGSILNIILSIAYYVYYQATYGQTLGKKAMGLKVVNEQGVTPSMTTFFMREVVGKFISAIILFIGYLMVLWDPKKQALHDKIAKTYVVKV